MSDLVRNVMYFSAIWAPDVVTTVTSTYTGDKVIVFIIFGNGTVFST